MAKAAAMWIRDGVLIDRMHINPVAFAFAYWSFIDEEARKKILLEELINFGFEKSGFSCADKMKMFNQEKADLLADIDSAAAFYNKVAAQAAESVDYFPGMVDLLKNLSNQGIGNFITSAIEQAVLDDWSKTSQGQQSVPFLQEILGRRADFHKGKDHFAYVHNICGGQKIYYIADAPAEISTAKQYADQYNIVPVGFANVIEREKVVQAAALFSLSINAERLRLADAAQIEAGLRKAGAAHIVNGSGKQIVVHLQQYFVHCL